VETPAPNPSDSEDVATALETAAIFAAKGDVSETAHWISRAAESASLHGDMLRASILARALADLPQLESESSPDAAPEARERRLPTAPPRRVSVRPPPPSERARASDESQPMLLVRPSTTPSPPRLATASASTKSTPAPALVARKSTPAAASVAPKPTPAPAAVAQKASAPVTATSSSRPLSTALAPNVAHSPRDHQEESAVRESSATAAKRPSERPSMNPALRHETHRPFPLHGARASIAASQGSTRFYVLKVLDEGEPVPQGEQEAYIVLVDPKASH
jgi:hypothetical protein